jgi:hypothetical protein
MVLPLLLGAVLVFSPVAHATRDLGATTSFRTPSGNIGCIFSSFLFAGARHDSIRCDIRSGLKPKPARPKNCNLDYGDSYELPKTGRTIVVCHGDTALDPHAPALAYGKTWQQAGLKCTAKTVGLRCTNKSGHGFFLSRAHSYRF